MKTLFGRLLGYVIVPTCIIPFVKERTRGKEERKKGRERGRKERRKEGRGRGRETRRREEVIRNYRREGNPLFNCVISVLALRLQTEVIN